METELLPSMYGGCAFVRRGVEGISKRPRHFSGSAFDCTRWTRLYSKFGTLPLGRAWEHYQAGSGAAATPLISFVSLLHWQPGSDMAVHIS